MKKLIASLQQQRQFHLKSQGQSMLPILQPNDVLYYKKTAFAQTKPNDLIMVKKGNNLFTHRIIHKTKKSLVTKGDNNLESDGKIYPRQIIAKVDQVKRNRQIFNPESLYLLQSTLYFQEIVKIKKALEKEKIDFVFLKGLLLHLNFEKSHPKRIYLDCDVLIKKQDFNKAQTILQQYNYKRSDNLLSKRIKRNIGEEMEVSYYKLLNGFAITFDLHFEVDITIVHLNQLELLYPQKYIDQLTREFLLTKKSVKIQNEPFFILNAEFLILYLALHFFHHNYQGAFRLEFLDKIICQGHFRSVLWTDISKKILDYQLQNFVYPVFVLLKKLYKTHIPIYFLKSIQPSIFYLNYLTSIINDPSSVFDDEQRIKAGVNRFKNLFYLSPRPLWIKTLVFLNPQVLYSIFWVATRRVILVWSFLRTGILRLREKI